MRLPLPVISGPRHKAGAGEQFGGVGCHIAFLECGDVVRRRIALGFGDGLADQRLGDAPEIAAHDRPPPLRHVERHGCRDPVGARFANRLDGACHPIVEELGERVGGLRQQPVPQHTSSRLRRLEVVPAASDDDTAQN
jgi:hypothetical protein